MKYKWLLAAALLHCCWCRLLCLPVLLVVVVVVLFIVTLVHLGAAVVALRRVPRLAGQLAGQRRVVVPVVTSGQAEAGVGGEQPAVVRAVGALRGRADPSLGGRGGASCIRCGSTGRK